MRLRLGLSSDVCSVFFVLEDGDAPCALDAKGFMAATCDLVNLLDT